MKYFLMAILFIIFFGSAPGAVSAEATGVENTPADRRAGGVKSLESRVRHLEQAVGRDVPTDRWMDRIQIGGRLEVEAVFTQEDDGTTTIESSDVDLAAVEIDVNAKLNTFVDGHIMIKYETETPDGKDDVFIDEGFITLTAPQRFPVYLIAGRQYLPFGNFPSVFVTDPVTLVLGETNDGAVIAGCQIIEDRVEISGGVFNGRSGQAGDDDAIDSYVASITTTPMDAVSVGVSYTSNVAGSDGLNGEMTDADNLENIVGGWSAFLEVAPIERITVIGEYLAAIDSFKAGEIYDAAETRERKPAAWNVELAVTVLDNLEMGGRYGGSDDGGPGFLPEVQYGCVVNWGIYGCNLALEYLHGEFEDDIKDVDTLTAQLAIEF